MEIKNKICIDGKREIVGLMKIPLLARFLHFDIKLKVKIRHRWEKVDRRSFNIIRPRAVPDTAEAGGVESCVPTSFQKQEQITI